MNSRQRRREKRRFRHTVHIGDPMRLIHEPDCLSDMLQWCHQRYGEDGYRFQWNEGMTFSFPRADREMEFKLTWA